MRWTTIGAAMMAVGGLLVVASPANAAAYTFTTVNVPGAFSTDVFGINNPGQVVGAFDFSHGFVRDTGGSFTTVDVPGASSTSANDINNAGRIVGQFSDGQLHGFLDSGGSFTTIDPPGSNLTNASGINDRGQIVGFSITGGVTQGFLRSASGSFSTVDVPGATETSANGINNPGLIVGAFTTGGVQHGFIDRDGTFTTIDVPGASATQAFGINSRGEIVGLFDDSTGRHGFLDADGIFTTIDVPGAEFTEAYGINDAGEISGRFEIGGLLFRGFLATPGSAVPEPSSFALLGVGVIGLGKLIGLGKCAAERAHSQTRLAIGKRRRTSSVNRLDVGCLVVLPLVRRSRRARTPDRRGCSAARPASPAPARHMRRRSRAR